MNVTRESVNSTEVTLSIQMNPEDEEPFLNRSYRRVVSRIQIPGFRRGKAPRSIVESHLSRSGLVQEALDFMIPETLDQVLKDENLQAFMEPQLEILDTEPVSFKAVVPLEPLVQLGDFRSMRLERPPVEVTEEQIDEVIERLRSDAAPWEPVDRPLKFGDLVNLNIQGTVAGEQVINNEGIEYVPQQDNLLPIPGFSIYLEGMTEGQNKEFTLTVPDDHEQTEYAGKECRFQAEVLSIKEKILPELDDEFAKGVRDGFDSLQALREDVTQQLTAASENAASRQLEQETLDKLLESTTIEASSMIYQRELDSMLEDRERTLRNQRLDMDTYLRFIGQTQEEWQEQLRPQAEQRLHTYLILRKLAEEEGIEVAHEEVQTEIDSMLSESGEAQDAVRQTLNSDNMRDSIRLSLLHRKVLQRLVDIVLGSAEANGAEPGTDGADTEETDTGDTADLPDGEEQTTPTTTDPEGSEEGVQPNGD